MKLRVSGELVQSFNFISKICSSDILSSVKTAKYLIEKNEHAYQMSGSFVFLFKMADGLRYSNYPLILRAMCPADFYTSLKDLLDQT